MESELDTISIGKERLSKMPEAIAIFDRAVAEERPITMGEISRAVGKYSSWLQCLCRSNCAEALDLRQRINAHNAALNAKVRWNRTLENRLCHSFKNSRWDKKQ